MLFAEWDWLRREAQLANWFGMVTLQLTEKKWTSRPILLQKGIR